MNKQKVEKTKLEETRSPHNTLKVTQKKLLKELEKIEKQSRKTQTLAPIHNLYLNYLTALVGKEAKSNSKDTIISSIDRVKKLSTH